jgi:hypothetical protein
MFIIVNTLNHLHLDGMLVIYHYTGFQFKRYCLITKYRFAMTVTLMVLHFTGSLLYDEKEPMCLQHVA